MSRKRVLAVDFDGVIHAYTKGWNDGSIYDLPMEGVKESLESLGEKFKIVVFTARPNIREIARWLMKYGIHFDEITHDKIPAVAYIDDRGIRFETWKQTLENLQLLNFI